MKKIVVVLLYLVFCFNSIMAQKLDLNVSYSGGGVGLRTIGRIGWVFPLKLYDPESDVHGHYCGDTVRMIAHPLPGYEFVLWEVGKVISYNQIDTFILVNEIINVYFKPKDQTQQFNLDVDFKRWQGNVTGYTSPHNDSYESGNVFQYGDVVFLSVEARPNYRFVGWVGDYTGSEPTITLIMSENKKIIAKFERKE